MYLVRKVEGKIDWRIEGGMRRKRKSMIEREEEGRGREGGRGEGRGRGEDKKGIKLEKAVTRQGAVVCQL